MAQREMLTYLRNILNDVIRLFQLAINFPFQVIFVSALSEVGLPWCLHMWDSYDVRFIE